MKQNCYKELSVQFIFTADASQVVQSCPHSSHSLLMNLRESKADHAVHVHCRCSSGRAELPAQFTFTADAAQAVQS